MADIKGYIIAAKNNISSPNIKYGVVFLADRMLFIKIDQSMLTEVLSSEKWLQLIIFGAMFGASGSIIGALIFETPEWALLGLAIGALVGVFIGNEVSQYMNKKEGITENTISQRLIDLSPEELLKLNKRNFEVLYKKIRSADYTRSNFHLLYVNSRSGILTLNLEGFESERYDISAKRSFDETLELLRKMLPCKVSKWEYIGIPKIPLAVDILAKMEKGIPKEKILDYISKKGINEADAEELLSEASTNRSEIRKTVKAANAKALLFIGVCFAIMICIALSTIS
ncbi:glycine zipper 2TM domain-containing protein [Dehalococcoides mccartyi]|uniref:Glycine zipper 2TM domain-containing protein n=1 Tax=Dehalococcoides mccartyi (strain CBDB1) TaxID=255470 RepID=A0A916NU25_DEHMC|nr:glycine zipper 2TM domain-containing protein [Dehalococcoides mccartyi]CAI82347.1 hypothetical protein cbdbA86 [Dehalococcoides mccartyi CBDB1]